MSRGTGLDPRDTKSADVYKAGRLAASLTRSSGGVRFAYQADYLDSPGPAVATTLPLTEQPVLTQGGAVPPFFANLLPEGRRLTSLRTAVKTSADDELSLLLAVGADPAGDVAILPAGAPLEEVAPTSAIVDTELSEVSFTEVLSAARIDPSALAGVQDKVSGRMITAPLVHAGRSHLLKITPPEYPRVVENEAFFLGLARSARLPVAEARVVHDVEGRSGLLVTRFDRVAEPDGRLSAVAMEDGAQLLGLHPADKYTVSFEDLAGAVARTCASPPLALRALITQLAFAWLTGNGDLHAKNISVLSSSGVWHTSPVYDIPSTVPYGDSTMALTVAGRRDGLSRKKLLTLGGGLGLPRAATERAIETALSATAEASSLIQDGAVGFDPRRRRDLVRVMTQRRRTLTE